MLDAKKETVIGTKIADSDCRRDCDWYQDTECNRYQDEGQNWYQDKRL